MATSAVNITRIVHKSKSKLSRPVPIVAPALPSSPSITQAPPVTLWPTAVTTPSTALPNTVSLAAVTVKKIRQGKRATQNPPATKKPTTGQLDYSLLLAKIMHYCHEYIPAEILATVDRHKPLAKTTPWITERSQTATKPGCEKRYFVLDARTWRLRQYGTEWEAKAVAENAAGIHAGNGVFIFYKENPKWLLFMQGFNSDTREMTKEFNAKMRSRRDFFPPVRNPTFIRNELKEEMARMKEKAGVGKKNKDGSPLFLLVCGALERIREGKI